MTIQLNGQAREEANVERYRRVFEELDLDSSGSLDEHEIQAGLQRMGYPSPP
jgi:Ca2+-binding EF-hand superfamily protein